MANAYGKKYDIIIFGATGYTGRYVIEELANSTKDKSLTWAIAGRNIDKLKESLEIVQKYLVDGVNIKGTDIIQADVYNKISISNMCKQAKLILNCVGPYKLYGEIVVASCIENGTHHIDLSGEIQYLETTQANYFHAAKERGVYIVQACGFDSIPADYGISLLQKNFQGDLNSVDSYVMFKPGSEGQTVNIGTWLSAVHSVADTLATRKYRTALKEKVFQKEMVPSKYPKRRQFPLFYSNVVKNWCLWFIGPDEGVIQRSQLFRNEFLGERPIQAHAYLKMQSFLQAVFYILFVGLFGFFSMFSFGRHLLSNNPSFFSGGMFSKSGPTRKQVEQGKTRVTLCGEGWAEKMADPKDQHADKPTRKMKLIINGPEPAYALTSICMVQSGITVLKETDKLPLGGGVLTPGVAFRDTKLRERLEERGVSFTFEE